jgi:flagellar hook-associated protein 1 FlgK
MGSTFSGYNISVCGMSANQKALGVVSSNLANVSTTGYSRKQINSMEQVITQAGESSTGTGVDVQEVKRARDILLDQTYRQQNAKSAYWESKSANLEDIQETLNEFTADDGSSENGLEQTLLDFFNSWDDLASDPDSQSSRQSVTENASTLISTMQDIDEQLQAMQYDCVGKVQAGVESLNNLAGQVATLNSQIFQAELGGVEAGDLRDQRDTLLDQMSALTNITTHEYSNGIFEVNIGGVSLVRGGTTRKLTAMGDGSATNPLDGILIILAIYS